MNQKQDTTEKSKSKERSFHMTKEFGHIPQNQNPKINFPTDFEQVLEMLLEKERENKALRAKLEEQKRNDYPEVLKVKLVAEILGVSEPTVYAYMKHNDFPALQLGGVARVRRDSLFRWLESKERK